MELDKDPYAMSFFILLDWYMQIRVRNVSQNWYKKSSNGYDLGLIIYDFDMIPFLKFVERNGDCEQHIILGDKAQLLLSNMNSTICCVRIGINEYG